MSRLDFGDQQGEVKLNYRDLSVQETVYADEKISFLSEKAFKKQ